MVRRNLRVGIIGRGMGGLAAAFAVARGGAEVTVLEAAHELGEIGADIQVGRLQSHDLEANITDVP